MTEQIKIDFEKTIKTLDLSKDDAKLKKKFLDRFIEKGFPSRKLENWKFSDINQIIQKNIEKKSDLIGQEIFLNDAPSQKEIVLENLSLFQWALKKTFLKR